ncbi:tRNA (adenosine(37)-N6)-threonylcarbamoyltransferase complex ATPase subunit type 1 TsaE [Candidatus Puniceispirillum sp.]|nr:tRNA (adenosine(37)-N6)-threonylcarbamoyltransferase complex ATPase subunit type 1 TsaE [Candidatus Puniceispirillum sp.]
MSILRLELPDLNATQRLGALLALDLSASDVIALSGALGAGKSALARAIIQAANPGEMDVPSPTFTLVQTYELQDGTPLWHLDLYRIESPAEAMELGLEDAFIDAACLIEWPERLEKLLPKDSLSIYLHLSHENDPDDVRYVDIIAPPHWIARVQAVIAKF